MTEEPTRRQYLLTAGLVGAAGMAGCAGSETASEATDTEPSADETADGTPTVTPATTLTGTPTESDESTDETIPASDVPRRSEVSSFAPDDTEGGDQFGEAVAVSDDGTTAIVGAFTDTDADGDEVGAAYVFTRDGDSWTQAAKLRPSDPGPLDKFGADVALSGDGSTALVGTGQLADEVYVFTQAGGEWSRQTTLEAEFIGSGFGETVALAGDGSTAIVALPGLYGEGGVVVYTRSSGSWTRKTLLRPADSDAVTEFARAVAMTDDGSTALIGAPKHADKAEMDTGQVYVFSDDGDGWGQRDTFVPSDADSGDEFGAAVALSSGGETALVGAPRGGDEGAATGGAYVFTRSDGWTQQAKLDSVSRYLFGGFGDTVDLDDAGETAVVGAVRYGDGETDGAGAAYLFTRSGDQWSRSARLQSATPGAGDRLGDAVALADDGTPALVGASGSDEYADSPNPGAVYVFDV